MDLDTQVTDVGLKTIGQLKNLRWLRIHTGRIWGPGLAELAHLKSLTFWGVGSSLTDASLASIGKLERLEALYFVRTSPSFTEAGMPRLKGLKRLKRIDFAQAQVGGRGGADGAVRRLSVALPRLESLQLIGPVTAEGMKALGTMQKLKRLHVALNDERNGYHGPTGVPYLAGLISLEDLHLAGDRALSDRDLVHLKPLTNLKDLFIDGRNVTDRGLAILGNLRQLESLHLWGTSVTNGGLRQLSGLTSLRNLDVRMRSSTKGVAELGELPMDLSGMKKLRRLFISGLSFDDAGLACLAKLRSLEDISIQGGYAQPRSFPAVSLRYLEGLPKLNSLYIGGLSDAWAEDLLVLGSLTSLGNVTLTGRISDAALQALGNLQSGWSLTVKTDQFIRAQTIADLKQRLATTDYDYVHIQDLPTKPKPRAQTVQPRLKRTRLKPSRVNRQRRQQQDRRR